MPDAAVRRPREGGDPVLLKKNHANNGRARMREEIRSVTPERWRDLERLFGPRGAYSNCWCMWWRLRRRDFRAMAPEERKRALRAWVRSGAQPGLLAYRRGEPVAWCALAPRDEYAALAASPTLKPLGDTAGGWRLTC